MKALSIRPEFAMEILRGEKTEEYRSWTTHYRGNLLICNSARKKKGTVAGHALCVAKIIAIEKRYNEEYDEIYYAWKFAPFREAGSYWIKPIPVKGQLKLFNVDDQLIHPAPFKDINSPQAVQWWDKEIAPLIY